MSKFLVKIRLPIPSSNVMIANFSAESWPVCFRPIADFDFEGLDGNPAQIRVYIFDGEEDKHIQVLDNRTDPSNPKSWKEKPVNYQPERIGPWVGYLEAEISEGDPPIAVG